MKRVLLVHPQFAIIGGAELVALQMLRWLIEREDVRATLLTLVTPNFDDARTATGLQIDPGRLDVHTVGLPFNLERAHGKFEMIKIGFLHRTARQISKEFDLCISSYNELDFGPGRFGIQYVHHPILLSRRRLQKLKIIDQKSTRDHIPFLNGLYLYVARLIRGGGNGFKKNRTLVNSKFMQDMIRLAYGIDSTVVYPGFLSDGRPVWTTPWEERDFTFVSVGRISEDKQVLRLIRLFRALRDVFPTATFVLAGRTIDPAYLSRVNHEAHDLNVPLQVMIDAPKDQIDALLERSKFFLHAKEHEHFGIAILEAGNAGCLTLVPDSGGQREIVSPPILRYSNPEELVRNVRLLMEDAAARKKAMEELQNGLNLFRVSLFEKRLEEIVGELLSS